MENYQQQPSANSSKIEKPHNFRFSTADKDFLKGERRAVAPFRPRAGIGSDQG